MLDEEKKWLQPIVRLAKEAGKAILEYYGLPKERLGVIQKKDHTPLTLADQRAHEVIFDGLRQLTPVLPILSEEGVIAPYEIRHYWDEYWLLDPLDGTRGFVNQLNEFTVNIALIEAGKVYIGVIYAPVQKLCYYALKNYGAFKQKGEEPAHPIATRKMNKHELRVLLGQYLHSSRLPDLFKTISGCEVVRVNSSLKFCYLAEGQGDIYPRLGETSEWDTAAGQCILEAAGGAVVDLNGQPLQYNAKESLVNPPFVAIGDPKERDSIIQLIQHKRSSL